MKGLPIFMPAACFGPVEWMPSQSQMTDEIHKKAASELVLAPRMGAHGRAAQYCQVSACFRYRRLRAGCPGHSGAGILPAASSSFLPLH